MTVDYVNLNIVNWNVFVEIPLGKSVRLDKK